MEEPRVVSTVLFAAEANAAGLTRALVRLVLSQWGLRELVGDAELIASELATNAVHATNAEESSVWVNSERLPPIIRVQVRLYDSFMIVAVWDRNAGEPKPAAPEAIDEGGRGLLIVENLSTRWGWDTVHPYSAYMGKVVWAELTLPYAPVNPLGLPRRMPGNVNFDVPIFSDERVLARVYDGLKRF